MLAICRCDKSKRFIGSIILRYKMNLNSKAWRERIYYMLPEGWWMRFGNDLCDDIEGCLKKMLPGAIDDFDIQEAGDENGKLYIKCNWTTENLRNIFDKYQNLSIRTCICCGKPAEFISATYIEPLCAQHAPVNGAIPINEYLVQAIKEV